MTICRILSASAVFLTIATASAGAAGEVPGIAVEPHAVEPAVGPHPSGNSVSPPVKFLWRLLAPKRKQDESAPPLAAEDPMLLTPPIEAAKASAVIDPRAEPPHAVVERVVPEPKPPARTAVAIPIPRPRPEMPMPIVTVTKVAEPLPSAEEALAPEDITGSISAPPTEAAKSAPPAVEAIPSPPPPPAEEVVDSVDSDDLLGDPTPFFGDDTGLAPQISVPDGIAAPKPSDGAPAAGGEATPSGISGEPYELVRTLQVLQDQIAQGSSEALAAQRVLRSEIDRKFAAAASGVWQDRRNAAAAIIYVLSGGPPALLRSLDSLDPKPAIDVRLFSGVLAYAEGREPEANQFLTEIDPADLPPSMGAQVALAKSALAARTDPKESMRLLAVARLLAPGTLVEEAALRRELFVADQMKDSLAVQALARQYLARFRHSVYAGNFRNRFAAAISRMNLAKDEESFQRIDDMLLPVEPEARGQLYLTVALAALVKGNADAGAFAAERAFLFAPAGSREEARAQLYRAASLVADPKAFDAALVALGKSDRDLLGSSDQNLHDAVSATIAGVRSGTEATMAPTKVAGLDNAGVDAVETTPLMTRAREVLAATDELIAGMAK